MPSINKREHEQFLHQLSLFFPERLRSSTGPDTDMEEINRSLQALEQLLASYQDGITQLQNLSNQYRLLMKKTKVSIRRYQLKQKYKNHPQHTSPAAN